MFKQSYKATNKDMWSGRADSEDNFDAFRWHQWIKCIDLSSKNLDKFEGKLGFCFLGFCCDKGVENNKGRPGASKAPYSIRKAMVNLPCWFKQDVKLFDGGDIICAEYSLEQCQEFLSVAVEKILNLNLFPIILGGGHEVAFGHYRGISNSIKKLNTNAKIGIINFDAHFDLRPYLKGENSSGTMFKQISDICKEENSKFSYMCIGIQKYSNTVDLFKTANKLGVTYILGKDMVRGECSWNMMEKLDNFIKEQEYIYITICSDVFSSAFAPGVSAPQPLGLDPDTVLNFLKYIVRSGKVISFDIAEVSPRFDQDNITANLAKILIFSVINTICQLNNLSVGDDLE